MPASSVLRGSRSIASDNLPARTSSVSSPTTWDRAPSVSSTASIRACASRALAMRGRSSSTRLASDTGSSGRCRRGGLFLNLQQAAHDRIGQADATGALQIAGIFLGQHRAIDATAGAVLAERSLGLAGGHQFVRDLFEEDGLELVGLLLGLRLGGIESVCQAADEASGNAERQFRSGEGECGGHYITSISAWRAPAALIA